MQLIYVYGGCSPRKYREYVESRGQRVQQQSQKYNQLLMEGLVSCGAAVSAVSSRPINRGLTSQVYFPGERDQENGIDYRYVPFLNLPVLRNLSVFASTFLAVLFQKTNGENTTLVCDALNISATAAGLCASKLRGIKTVGIVTDVPCHRPENEKKLIHQRINLWLMKQFDGYLLLTEQMNDIVNPKGRPYVVMEGHVDISMASRDNKLSDKYPQKVCLYAGSLLKVYGIENLVRGFVMADIADSELHIYGSGGVAEELKTLAKQHENVKYMGIAPNETIVREELKATLLVNPRPTDADYTKYSFPSKNMEYMASGTPVLTTCLPGMPLEYNDHVFLLQDESAQGIAEALREVLSLSSQELHAKGMTARKFVLATKNNVAQAQRLLVMISKMEAGGSNACIHE